MMAFPEFDEFFKNLFNHAAISLRQIGLKTRRHIRSVSFSNDRLLVPFYVLFFANHVIVAVTFNRVSDFLSDFIHELYTTSLTVI